MTLTIDKITEPSSKESPITVKEIRDIVEAQLTSPNELQSNVLKELIKKSSKHKFIVQTTNINVEDTNVDVGITTKFGAAWEPEKDGYITVTVSELEPKLERSDTIGGIVEAYGDGPEKTEKTVKGTQILVSIFWLFVG